MTMDRKQQSRLTRLVFFDDLRIALPIIALGLAVTAALGLAIYQVTLPTKLVTCRYQYFVISPSKWNPGAAIVICKLSDDRIISFTKPAGWVEPAFNSEMEVRIPK